MLVWFFLTWQQKVKERNIIETFFNESFVCHSHSRTTLFFLHCTTIFSSSSIPCLPSKSWCTTTVRLHTPTHFCVIPGSLHSTWITPCLSSQFLQIPIFFGFSHMCVFLFRVESNGGADHFELVERFNPNTSYVFSYVRTFKLARQHLKLYIFSYVNVSNGWWVGWQVIKL